MSAYTSKIESKIDFDFCSPYKLAKIESELRNAAIPPQKLYGYVSKGYIVATQNSTGKLQISKEAAVAYLEKTLKRNS
jgi:predicted site-specific integrase-resolvase